MQETDFIAQNKDKWKALESELKMDNKDPEKLLELFIQTTDDLSFSRTHYPNRTVRYYLNGFARSVHAALYENRKRKKSAFISFWQLELPQATYNARRSLLLALGIMVLGLLIGFVSCSFDDNFPAIVLSQEYIDMTEQLIAEGKPLGVYALDDDPLHMFLRIAWNNIQYAFGAFVLGALFGVGTVYALLSTGIMVGAFTMFFVKKGLFQQMFFAVMLHGTLELGTIVIAGGAGLLLARAAMFPGSYTRLESIVKAARNGMKIMIAAAVFLLYAALIEGYLTRYTDASNWFRGSLIFLSAAILIGYFVVYPRYLFQQGRIDPNDSNELTDTPKREIRLDRVKTGTQMVSEALILFLRNSAAMFRIASAIALLGMALLSISNGGVIHQLFDTNSVLADDQFYVWRFYRPLYVSDSYVYLIAASLLLGVALTFSTKKIHALVYPNERVPWTPLVLTAFTGGLMLVTAAQVHPGVRWLVLFVLLPVVLFVVVMSRKDDANVFAMAVRAVGLVFAQVGNFLVCHIVVALLHLVVLFLTQSMLMDYVLQFVQINVPSTLPLAAEIPYMVVVFIMIFILMVVLQVLIFALFLYQASAFEVRTAHVLVRRIRNIGKKRKIYGVDQEDV